MALAWGLAGMEVGSQGGAELWAPVLLGRVGRVPGRSGSSGAGGEGGQA